MKKKTRQTFKFSQHLFAKCSGKKFKRHLLQRESCEGREMVSKYIIALNPNCCFKRLKNIIDVGDNDCAINYGDILLFL